MVTINTELHSLLNRRNPDIIGPSIAATAAPTPDHKAIDLVLMLARP